MKIRFAHDAASDTFAETAERMEKDEIDEGAALALNNLRIIVVALTADLGDDEPRTIEVVDALRDAAESVLDYCIEEAADTDLGLAHHTYIMESGDIEIE